MTTPSQMGAEPRPEQTDRQQQAQIPQPAAGQPEPPAAPPQMGAPLFRDWAAI